MTTRRLVLLLTALAVAILAGIFVMEGWDQADKIAIVVAGLVAVAALGIAVWAALPLESAGTARLKRFGGVASHMPITPADVEDLYNSRLFFERAVVMDLAKNRRVLPAAWNAVKEILAMGPSSNPASYEPDIKFHKALVEAMGCTRLQRMHAALMDEVLFCMTLIQSSRLLTPTEIGHDHQDILEQIELGDSAQAVRILTDHLIEAREKMKKALTPCSEVSLEEA